MYVRVLTLRYQEGEQGFPEGALRQATAGREVLEVRDVCGTITVRNGACYRCHNCGNSMGCS